jgi:MFS family permease
VKAGLLLRNSPQLVIVIVMHGAGILASTVPAIAMPVLLTVRLHASVSGYGLVMAAAGLGALAGNPFTSNLRLASRFPGAYFAGYIATGLALAATGQAHSLIVVALLSFTGGLVTPVATISLRTYLAQRFARAERLSIMAVDQAVIRAAGTVGMLVLPVLTAKNPGLGFTIAGLATASVALIAFFVTTRLPVPAEPVPAEQPVPAGNR